MPPRKRLQGLHTDLGQRVFAERGPYAAPQASREHHLPEPAARRFGMPRGLGLAAEGQLHDPHRLDVGTSDALSQRMAVVPGHHAVSHIAEEAAGVVGHAVGQGAVAGRHRGAVRSCRRLYPELMRQPVPVRHDIAYTVSAMQPDADRTGLVTVDMPDTGAPASARRCTHGALCSLRAGLAWVLALAVPVAWAQGGLYRCGNTYSQVPCSTDAQAASVPTGAAPDPAPGLTGAEVCAAHALRTLGADSGLAGRLESSQRGPAEVIQYAGQPLATRTWRVTLAVRTVEGLAAGHRAFRCHLSEDERRVLRISAAAP